MTASFSSLGAQSDGRVVADHASPRVTDLFPIGERMEFEGRFGLLRLGRATMTVVGTDTIRGDSTTHLRWIISANALGLIRLDDQFDSWVGTTDFLSRRFTQRFDEFGKHRETAYEIFPDSGYYTSLEADTAMEASDNPLDETAFFYYVRTLDLEPGQKYQFDRYFRPDRNPVIIEVMGRDTIDVPAGRFTTIVVKPIIQGGGIFKESSDGRMWITDDPRRLIVQMKSKFGFGTVTLRLIDFGTADSEAAPGSER
jgi:Protein of unknown function (DUF3108)